MKTDLQLVEEVKSGERESFEILMQRHGKFLMSVVVRLTRDLDAAEDIVQEAFIKAYRRIALFQGRASFRSWLYQIAMNTARNRYRRQSREVPSSETVEIAVESQAELKVIEMDLRNILQVEVERLPDRQKTALSLRIFEDLSFKEIAEMMECPYDTAKANYRHALLKLKDRLQGNKLLRGWSQTTQSNLSVMEVAIDQREVEGQ